MRQLFIFLSMAVCSLVNAQTIRGYVFSSPGNKPVEFANVVLLNLPDSSFKTGVITYMDGNYTIEKLQPGKYYVKSSFMGFEENGIGVELAEGENLMADTIYLHEKTNEIEGVDVTANMIRGEEMVDRTVYSIPPEVAKVSTNGYDILRKIPSVQVDFNNNITLNGKSNFIIQVDGKQRDKEFLARLMPGDIKSIEIIHNPSGKYDGSIDGVINVKLREGARAGINGNFMAMARPAKKTTGFGNAGIDYGLQKITFYVSAFSFFQTLDNNTTNFNRFSFNVDSVVDNKGKGDFLITAGAVNTGFDYYMNDKNNLSLNLNYKPTVMKTDLLNGADILLDNQLSNYQGYKSNIDTRSNETNASLFYKREFKKPIQEFTAEATFYQFSGNDNNSFSSNIYEVDRITLVNNTSREEVVLNNRNYLSTKVDYVQPLGITTRFEAGYQFYMQQMEYDFNSSDVQLSNVFNYSESRNAIYAGFTWNTGGFGFQTTLRAEHSDILVNKDIKSDYFTFLPSTNLQYKITGKQNIKFTYNRRINRPGIYSLNPFEKLNNNLTISTGNPYLEPEHRDKLQLTYSINFGKNFISPNIYYEKISDKTGTTNRVGHSPLTGSETIFSSPDNLLTGHEEGLGLSAMLYFININGRVYRGEYDAYASTLVNIPAREYFSFSINSYAFAPLFKKKVNAFAFLAYNGVNIDAQSRTYSTPFYGLGAQYNKENHSFGAFYFLPFGKELTISRTVTRTEFLQSESTNSFDVAYYFQFQYAYKFNKGKNVKKLNRESRVESDTKSGGIGR